MAGKKRRDTLPPNDPDQWIHYLQRSRMCWAPELVPALLTWLSMQEMIHREARAEFSGRHARLNAATRDGMVRRLDSLIEAFGVLAESVVQPWRRVDWYACASKVMGAIGEEGQGGTPGEEQEG